MKNPKEEQLEIFSAFTIPERYEIEKIHELEVQQDSLRKGFFKRYKEQCDRINKLENMFADLLEMIHHAEERKLENVKWSG